jgi:hypothetical protein
LPLLPAPPDPETILGPDGRRHRIRYRIWRWPSGIVAEAEERLRDAEGYAAKVHGSHDKPVEALIVRVMAEIRSRIARLDLELAGHGSQLHGRLVWDGHSGGPYGVVDGRQLTWEEFGRALEPFEGWEFHLSFDDGLDGDDAPDEPSEDDGEVDPWPPLPGHVH